MDLDLNYATTLVAAVLVGVGIGCMAAGYLLAAWSIGHLRLSLVEPLLTTYLV